MNPSDGKLPVTNDAGNLPVIYAYHTRLVGPTCRLIIEWLEPHENGHPCAHKVTPTDGCQLHINCMLLYV